MPNRIIHEKACNSQTLDALNDGAERLFWRLTTKADDYGRFDADPRALLGACFPLRIGRMKPDRVLSWRDELALAGLVALYTVGDRVYGVFVHWPIYQRQRESRPKYPDPKDGMVYHPMPAATRGESRQPAAYARARVSGAVIRESLNERRDMSGSAAPDVGQPEASESRPPQRSRSNGSGVEHEGHEHGPAGLRTAACEILAFLNKKAGKHFQPTPVNVDLITARLREGATVEHCRAIVGRKCAQWKGDAKMDQYLRPSTLFNREKFSQYQGELPASAFERDGKPDA